MTKLYLINNGLKNLRGHYYETSVAVAEAARGLGLEPILVAHRSCPADLAPDWLPCHPVMTTDHWMPELTPRVRHLVRSLLPAALHEPVRRLAQLPLQWQRAARRVLTLRRPKRHAVSRRDGLVGELERIGALPEIEHSATFRQELSELLEQTGCTHEDHVLLLTAHGRELVAVQDFVLSQLPKAVPTFHLEFRYDLQESSATYRERHETFFKHARARPGWQRMRLYADTEELAVDLEHFSGLDFATLPIPFRKGLLQPRTGTPDRLCIVYLGEARDEKGFHWLPKLVDAFEEEQRQAVRFVFQATLDETAYAPESRLALKRLQRYDSRRVCLVGEKKPLDAAAYYRVVSDGDILVCPFDAGRYRRRSSGTLTEGIAAGMPTVVPRNTWLARHQPPGSGETFGDRDSFVQAVKRVCEGFPRYKDKANASRERWLSVHSPRNLVLKLIE